MYGILRLHSASLNLYLFVRVNSLFIEMTKVPLWAVKIHLYIFIKTVQIAYLMILPIDAGMLSIALLASLSCCNFCRLPIPSGIDVIRLSERSSTSNVLMPTIISGTCKRFYNKVKLVGIARGQRSIKY